MLRFHFTAQDLARTRVAAAPHPLWEIAVSLHRFQTRKGRWAYAHWYRTACEQLRDAGLGPMVHQLLLPLFPRASYFPDFLTPAEGAEGLEAGLDAVLAAPRQRVAQETRRLARTIPSPDWVSRLTEGDMRRQLVQALRAYHHTVIAPHADHIGERLQAERIRHAQALLNLGTEALLGNLAPTLRWHHPVLEIATYPHHRDIHLNGRGLLLIPSYFCWKDPITLADPDLPPVIMYPLHHAPQPAPTAKGQPLHALLGRTRATILHATATGATTTEAARHAGVSTGTATHHTTALRNAGLISSHRQANTVLHVLTPLGAALLAGVADPDRNARQPRIAQA
ncbi:ArsR family transcriptional regulator [Streptomyces tauricus]|uniref:ArsR family transcriptional regulator n=1 Tax=Streptomyces tauricus TaxID=68274 RepID=A0ABZ1JV59_9ACTN|nr:ArsR family transcriptional regulator [Streptomyces tauricus]